MTRKTYRAYADAILASYMDPALSGLATEVEVAKAIVAAASDDTPRLRFVVGDDVRLSAHMRRETSEQTYTDWAFARYKSRSQAL